MAYIVLQGGGEFQGRMRRSDLRAIALCGGMDVPTRRHQAATMNAPAETVSAGLRRWVRGM